MARFTCSRCRRHLHESEFASNKRAKNGLQSNCRSCCAEMWVERKQRVIDNGGTKPVAEKSCNGCGTVKPASMFYRDKYHTSGKTSRCKECVNREVDHRVQRTKQAPKKVPKEATCTKCGETKPSKMFSSNSGNLRGVTATCLECRSFAHVKRKYGISKEEYLRLWEQQGGVCAACGQTCKRRLCVDHCHSTGVIRGLLCNACNKSIGALGDTAQSVSRARAYLYRSLVAEQVWGGVL